MAVVKGSKQYRMVVVPYRPWLPIVSIVTVLAVMLLVAVGAYKAGLIDGRGAQKQTLLERDRLLAEVTELSDEAGDLRQQVTRLTLGAQVDHQASEDVRAEVIALKSEIAALEEDISFYRGMMSPSDVDQGLTIGSVNIVSTGVSRVYDYKVMVQQLAQRHERLSGSMTFQIVGHRDGVPATLALKDVDTTVDAERIKLRFKYFQAVEGQLKLPEGFESRGSVLGVRHDTGY